MQTSEVLRAYYSRVVPVIPELFNMAYAICGNYDLAEYALQYTLMEAWVGESHGGMGFREGLRNILRRVAMEEALELRTETPEYTWNAFTEESDDPVLGPLARENREVRRIAALRYGCGLSPARIARLTGLTPARVREALERFEKRVKRELSASEKRRADGMIARAIHREFSRRDDSMPSLSAVYRAFEAEASETRRPRHLVSRIVRRAVCVLLALLCAVTFWFAAALIRPVTVEMPVAEVQTTEIPETE